jgi:hypothetical protein
MALSAPTNFNIFFTYKCCQGHDDATAILLALYCTNIRLLGVSTVRCPHTSCAYYSLTHSQDAREHYHREYQDQRRAVLARVRSPRAHQSLWRRSRTAPPTSAIRCRDPRPRWARRRRRTPARRLGSCASARRLGLLGRQSSSHRGDRGRDRSDVERGRGLQGHRRGIWTSDEHRALRERLPAPLGRGRKDRVHGRWNRHRKSFRGSRCGSKFNIYTYNLRGSPGHGPAAFLQVFLFLPPQIIFVLT